MNVGSVVNSTFADTNPALSPNGLSLYFDSNRPGGSGGRDLWVSERVSPTAPWGAPVDLGSTVNSSADDANPALSADGHWLFFVSPRSGGFGGSDLYESFRADVHDDFDWQAPVNLGPGVNTAATENGTGGLGADGTWGSTVLVSELSSPSVENRPNLRLDGLEIFFYSTRPGGLGGSDSGRRHVPRRMRRGRCRSTSARS